MGEGGQGACSPAGLAILRLGGQIAARRVLDGLALGLVFFLHRFPLSTGSTGQMTPLYIECLM